MSDGSDSVMDRLKTETVEQHHAAEHHPFHRDLAKGRVSRDQYYAYLGQMLHVHRGLESLLRRIVAARPDVASVVTDEQFQAPYLEEDLLHFGVDPETAEPSPATGRFLDEIARCDADADWLRVLGMHYVLEGSNNGSRFVSMNVAKMLGQQQGSGLRYLNPYGERQREVWAGFKERMNAVGFTDAQKREIVEGAKAMFDWISEISDDLAAVPAS